MADIDVAGTAKPKYGGYSFKGYQTGNIFKKAPVCKGIPIQDSGKIYFRTPGSVFEKI